MIDVTRLQRRLAARGFPVESDGRMGPVTLAAFMAAVAGRAMAPLHDLAQAAAPRLADAELLAHSARLANFVAQAAHESNGFRNLEELWGPTEAQRGYEGRADLGNEQPGDGFRYRGRGLFQITGRATYRRVGATIGLPLEASPELAASPDGAVLTALAFWAGHGLSALADAGLDDDITHRINGGTNGITERRALVTKAKGLLL